MTKEEITKIIQSLTIREKEILSCLVDIREGEKNVPIRYNVTKQRVGQWIARTGHNINNWRDDLGKKIIERHIRYKLIGSLVDEIADHKKIAKIKKKNLAERKRRNHL